MALLVNPFDGDRDDPPWAVDRDPSIRRGVGRAVGFTIAPVDARFGP